MLLVVSSAPSATLRKAFTSARSLGSGTDRISLNESEMFCLIAQCCSDLGIAARTVGAPPFPCRPSGNYYDLPLAWFSAQMAAAPPSKDIQQILAECASTTDFLLYFTSLAALHKRRLKYQRILTNQKRPTMDQVGPRSLLEFGAGTNSDLLASWMIWRKWIYDIDGRSGQETGYMFEPILASCIGGEPISASNSPIKIIDEHGKEGGRQIDCYVGDGNLAYEFKIRVTEAASAKGRWDKEVSFPQQASAVGLIPILIVLDPTESSRLTDIGSEFKKYGGDAFIGVEAWKHMSDRSGPIMATFLERYIEPPIFAMVECDQGEPAPQPLTLSWASDHILIKGQAAELRIPRAMPRNDDGLAK